MIVILGSGISGLILAQRLIRGGKKNFIILDRVGFAQSGNNLGFFYAHEPSPLTSEKPFDIITDVCPDGSTAKYAEKVYGNGVKVNPEKLSFGKYGKAKTKIGQGWEYLPHELEKDIRDYYQKADVYRVDLQRKVVYSKDGRSWQYSYLLSTVPLPVFIRIAEVNWIDNGHSLVLHSKPIYIKSGRSACEHDETAACDKMLVHYCASDCHPWYRATFQRVLPDDFYPMGRFEYTTPVDGNKLLPGKIWYEDPNEEQSVIDLDGWLESLSVFLFGRYAKWKPKYLTHMVWKESEGLLDLAD